MQKKIVLRSTAMVGTGVALTAAVMVIVYAAMGKFTWGVLLGALLGVLFAVFNFYLRSIGQVKALEKGSQMQAKQAASLSYSLRMLGMIGIAAVGFLTKWYDGVAFLLPQLFAQVVVWIYYIYMIQKEKRMAVQTADAQEKEDEEPDE